MKKHELSLIVDILEELTDRYSSDGCNDFEYPKYWTNDQKLEYEKIIMGDDYNDYEHDDVITYAMGGNIGVVYELIRRLELEIS